MYAFATGPVCTDSDGDPECMPYTAKATGKAQGSVNGALPYKTIQLDTLKNRLAAWQLAGNIFMSGETENTEPGSEIVYHPRDEKPLPFTPGIIHGDLDLDLDFMLSEGSLLTIDFKNRYALLLYPGGTFNSMSEKKWQVFTTGTHSRLPDCGSICMCDSSIQNSMHPAR